jgi:primosomal protein N' (replication factor Y)
VQFAAQYYQRAIGEVALAALPPQLRDMTPTQLARRLKKHSNKDPQVTAALQSPWPLSEQQSQVLSYMDAASGPFLIHGATGSGKTGVYLQAIARSLAQDPEAQALMMVPEINLTPQLEERVKARFGAEGVVSMHSGMTGPQRLKSWLAAHNGSARIVLGTRMAVFASMPNLKWIVVDEEHDASYKATRRRSLFSARFGGLPRQAGRRESHSWIGHTLTGKLASRPPRTRRWPLSAIANASANWRRPIAIGAACRHEPSATQNGVVCTFDCRHSRARGQRRAKHVAAEPAWLCARVALRRLRLEK